ncbi:Otopetrin domain containing protein [Aphelenchoides bicaudatus]|nr:Otopetrin domain containing protein [Aphelenchoides bicaudatus]
MQQYDESSLEFEDRTEEDMSFDEKEEKAITRSNSINSSSTTTKTNVVIMEEQQPLRWVDNIEAKNSVLVALTAFYAMILTIFALVFELSHLLGAEKRRTIHTKDLCFGIYMYGVSILFLFYCYVVLLLNPRWQTTIQKFKVMISESTQSLDATSTYATTVHRQVSHDSPSAGSLFLRLGAVVFGVIGTVYHAFNAFLCTGDDACQGVNLAVDALSIVFIFFQMHFLFCNQKISITGSQTIARFGTMHLVAANLWTWIRYILIEEGVMDREIREIFSKEGNENSTPRQLLFTGSSLALPHSQTTRYCEGAECILGSVSEIMYTSMVEYSLIGAAIMFIVWRNIGHCTIPNVYTKRKHQIRMDCSKTTSGFFAGLIFLAGTFTSMAVFYGYTIMGRNNIAAMVFGVTDIAQYLIASIGCIYALIQMRNLRYYGGIVCGQHRHHELLDMLLLLLGMTGEMLYSVAGLVGLTGIGSWHPLSIVLFIVHITRDSTSWLAIVLNLHCWEIENTRRSRFEALTAGQASYYVFVNRQHSDVSDELAGVSEEVVNFYGHKSWVFLVRSFSPLTIFFRFHSSSCLAEIFKTSYAWKS